MTNPEVLRCSLETSGFVRPRDSFDLVLGSTGTLYNVHECCSRVGRRCSPAGTGVGGTSSRRLDVAQPSTAKDIESECSRPWAAEIQPRVIMQVCCSPELFKAVNGYREIFTEGRPIAAS